MHSRFKQIQKNKKMKKYKILAILSMLYFSLSAQEGGNVDSLINQGVEFHDQGDYGKAISHYEKALEFEPNNTIALAEKAFSLLALKEYGQSIKVCKQAIKSNPESKGLKFVYTTYGNALDASEKPKKAVELYNQGIEQFPDYYQLCYNKGVTLSGLQKYDEALLSFQESVSLNPQHASSHNAIGRILMMNNSNIPSLLAFGRFFVIEPQGGRAKSNLPFVQKIMTANVEKTGKNSITINIDENSLSDANQEETKANNFGMASLILSTSAALDYDEDNKDKSEVELFRSKFETLCSLFKDVQNDNFGFYWEYYVPYFIEMLDQDMIETFSYIVYASSENQEVKKWLDENRTEIDSFYDWSSAYEWE